MDTNEKLFSMVKTAMGRYSSKTNSNIILENIISKPKNIYQEPSTKEIIAETNYKAMNSLARLTTTSSYDITNLIMNIKSKVNPRILKQALADIDNPGNPLIILCPQIHKGNEVNGVKQKDNIIVDPVITSWNMGGVEYVNSTRLHRDLLRNNRDLIKGYVLSGKLMRDLRNDTKRKNMYSTSQMKPALAIIFSHMILRILLKKSIIKAEKVVDQAVFLYGMQKWYVFNQLNNPGDSLEQLQVVFENALRMDKKTRDTCPESIDTLEELWQEIDELATDIINKADNSLNLPSIFNIKNFIVFYFAIATTIKDVITDGTHSYALTFLARLMHPVDMNSNIIKAYGKEAYLFTDKSDVLIVAILNIAENTNIYTSRELKNALKTEQHIQKLTINVINKIKEAY